MVKKIAGFVFIGALLAGIAYSDIEPKEDMTAQDLSALRKKMSRVKREMDLLIKDMVSGASAASDVVLKDFAGDVSIDVLQNEKNVIVKADLPGMEKDKINIALESGRFLKISGSRDVLKSRNSPGVVRQERFFGSFEKTVELPCEVENFGINATYKDGVLEITIPKKAPAKENKVKISVK
ncbi:MAG: Hsp20/alpha crystallin family protein [Candidatus Omnitrophota bacterium]|jgi:HSP20 family protein|nr:Hsp20/alpha crystallin family protein [Candidatus Omnitrophota bacterium]